LETLKIGSVFGHHGRLVNGHVAAEGLALLAALKVVVGTVGALADNAKLAGFHALDLSDLLKQ
jgi:hypothetical protein